MTPDFQHGYTGGVEQVRPDNYEGYLSSQINHEWLTARIAEKQAAGQRIDTRLTETRTSRQTMFGALQAHMLTISTLAKQVERFESDQQAITDEQASLQMRRENAATDYSLLAGLLFLVAAVSFLAGDLIISHEIVAYALNIRDSTEAWAFAVGLAMVSVLLKPVYDRIIEQPYQADPVRNQGRYYRFKIGLAIFSVVTLVVLGWFRYEAYRTDQLKAAINKSIKNLQLNAPLDASGNPVPLTPAVMQQIEKQLQDADALNLDLVNSPVALLSFVLSGVLFALAGAVCLGISLPVLQAFWFRWLQVDIRRGKLRRRRKRLMKQLLPAEQALTEHLTRKTVLEHDLSLLPDLATLESDRQALADELANLLQESRLAETDSRIASYNDGYARGEAARDAQMDADFEQTQLDLRAQSNGGSVRPNSTERPGRGRSLRPHQAIRQAITNGLMPEN